MCGRPNSFCESTTLNIVCILPEGLSIGVIDKEPIVTSHGQGSSLFKFFFHSVSLDCFLYQLSHLVQGHESVKIVLQMFRNSVHKSKYDCCHLLL